MPRLAYAPPSARSLIQCVIFLSAMIMSFTCSCRNKNRVDKRSASRLRCGCHLPITLASRNHVPPVSRRVRDEQLCNCSGHFRLCARLLLYSLSSLWRLCRQRHSLPSAHTRLCPALHAWLASQSSIVATPPCGQACGCPFAHPDPQRLGRHSEKGSLINC